MSEPSSPTPPTPVSELPAWLDTLKRTYGLQGAVGGAVIPVWALVFKLKKNQDEVFEISEECRLILERIVRANIQFDTQFSRDGDEIFILLGMDETTLMEEATYYMPLPMKLKWKDPVHRHVTEDGRAMDGTYNFHMQIKQHFVPYSPQMLFPSGFQQRLVSNRLERITKMNMEVKLMTSKKTRDQLLQQVLARKGGQVQVFRLRTLLESYGCTTGTSELAKAVRLRLPISMAQYDLWLEHDRSTMVDVNSITNVLNELLERDASNNRAVTAGSFIDYFPVHHDPEITWLKENWGTYDMVTKRFFVRDKMGERWLAWHYQPLEEVRAYFGDHVALYFAWQGLYTRKLVMPAVLGVMTMVGHLLGGVDKNPLTVVYSIFLALWSTLFLEAWKRVENELKFQWGSEGFEMHEQPRPQFRGQIERHEITGVEKLVHKNLFKRGLILFGSNLAGFLIICVVITAAMNAFMVRELTTPSWARYQKTLEAITNATQAGEDPNAEHVQEVEDMSWSERNLDKLFKWGSSVCSLTMILIASKLYKGVARWLTDKENHRTQTEHDDSLIVKNFMFEFINNYFTLFFIAFLIGIPIEDHPLKYIWEIDTVQSILGVNEITDLTQCPEGSCMSVLQRQLIVVFTGKQIFQQIKQVMKAKSKQKLRLKMESLSIDKMNKQRQRQGLTLIDKNLDHNSVEYQWSLDSYGSTFEDFKEMSLQFGYVTLFAVSFPLAALFAYINNIFEMRLDAYQCCVMHRRALWRVQEDIGSWSAVFNSLSIICVITNACLIGFVGSQMTDVVGSGDEPEGSPSDVSGEVEGFMDRVKMYRMWAIVVFTEHVVFLVRTIVVMISPSNPDWINDARDAIDMRKEQDLGIDADLETETQRRLQLAATFRQLDTDGDGMLSQEEIEAGRAAAAKARTEAASFGMGRSLGDDAAAGSAKGAAMHGPGPAPPRPEQHQPQPPLPEWPQTTGPPATPPPLLAEQDTSVKPATLQLVGAGRHGGDSSSDVPPPALWETAANELAAQQQVHTLLSTDEIVLTRGPTGFGLCIENANTDTQRNAIVAELLTAQAKASGLVVGCEIVAVNGNMVTNAQEASDELRNAGSAGPGAQVALTVSRVADDDSTAGPRSRSTAAAQLVVTSNPLAAAASQSWNRTQTLGRSRRGAEGNVPAAVTPRKPATAKANSRPKLGGLFAEAVSAGEPLQQQKPQPQSPPPQQQPEGDWMSRLDAAMPAGVHDFQPQEAQQGVQTQTQTQTQSQTAQQPHLSRVRPPLSLHAAASTVQLGQRALNAWEEFRTDDGVPYYYHAQTGATTWEHPTLQGGGQEGLSPTSGADGFGTGEVRGGPANLVQLQQGGAEQELFRLWRQIDVQARGTLPFESIVELLEQIGCPLPQNVDQHGLMLEMDPASGGAYGECSFDSLVHWMQTQGAESQRQLQMLDALGPSAHLPQQYFPHPQHSLI